MALSSDFVKDDFPSGTRMSFRQSSSPGGWTKDVSTNDNMLRIVTGTAGSNSANNAASSIISSNVDLFTHTLTISEMSSHSHSFQNPTGGVQVNTDPDGNLSIPDKGTNDNLESDSPVNIDSTGSDSQHDHDLPMSVSYKDIILASRDDISISSYYAGLQSGTRLLCHQDSAPTNFTKITDTQFNDTALRQINGSIADFGGNGFSAEFATRSLSDTTLSTFDIPSHSHTYTQDWAGQYESEVVQDSPGDSSADSEGQTLGASGSDGTHTHGGIDMNLMYNDVILIEKD